MNKLNVIKWIASLWKRPCKESHVVEVVVYDNGRVVERGETVVTGDYHHRLKVLTFANGVTSSALGIERHKAKGRA